MQGEAPRSELLDRFRDTPGAVLLATSSFWEGVDVVGEQLSCVIIDKLPFAVPGDPLVSSRIDWVESRGGSGFHDYQVPMAILGLKQGLGRLIRSRQRSRRADPTRQPCAAHGLRRAFPGKPAAFSAGSPPGGGGRVLELAEQSLAKPSLRDHGGDDLLGFSPTPGVPRGHSSLSHGHNFRVEAAVVARKLDKLGLGLDFLELEKDLKDILAPYDHRHLNELAPFDDLNPTTENMARWFFQKLERENESPWPRG